MVQRSGEGETGASARAKRVGPSGQRGRGAGREKARERDVRRCAREKARPLLSEGPEGVLGPRLHSRAVIPECATLNERGRQACICHGVERWVDESSLCCAPLFQTKCQNSFTTPSRKGSSIHFV